MTVHFISKYWNRVNFCISCSKSDESQNAKNIFNKIEKTAKIGVSLRENIANVKQPSINEAIIMSQLGALTTPFNL